MAVLVAVLGAVLLVLLSLAVGSRMLSLGQTWQVDVYDGLRRRQACQYGAQTRTAAQDAGSVELSCTLRTVRAWSEPWAADPLPGTYYIRLTTVGLTAADLGLPVTTEVRIDSKEIGGAAAVDGSLSEPTVLPAKYPNLLVNGSSGIAVGMATNMPPHNISETINACLMIMENPNATVSELMTVLPGPDFPTAGFIHGYQGIRDAYETGRGIIQVRARAGFETIKKSERQQIVVSEIPSCASR